jgi:uncharacterized protein (TIGR03086 family)
LELRSLVLDARGRSGTFPQLADFAQAADAIERLLASVAPDEWSVPTPCARWNLAQLTEHLIDVNYSFATELAGAPGTTHVNDAPAHAVLQRYRISTAQLQHGLATAERDGDGLSARLRGRLALRVTDLLIHGWDIATATGQPAHLPDEITKDALTFAHRRMRALRRSGQFAEPQPVDDHAPALTRLAAFSGRVVG